MKILLYMFSTTFCTGILSSLIIPWCFSVLWQAAQKLSNTIKANKFIQHIEKYLSLLRTDVTKTNGKLKHLFLNGCHHIGDTGSKGNHFVLRKQLSAFTFSFFVQENSPEGIHMRVKFNNIWSCLTWCQFETSDF